MSNSDIRLEKYSEMLGKLVPGLIDIFRDDSVKIILYGSAARGEDTDESDIDIAVIAASYTNQMKQETIDFSADIGLEYDRLVSVHMIEEDKFAEWADIMPFYQNIKKDGIVLWPAA